MSSDPQDTFTLSEAKQSGLLAEPVAEDPRIARLKRRYEARYGKPLEMTGLDTPEHVKLHGRGNAGDIRSKTMTPDERAFTVGFLRRKGYEAEDYTGSDRPKSSTGPHIHFQRKDTHTPPPAGTYTLSQAKQAGLLPDRGQQDTAQSLELARLGMKPFEVYQEAVGPALRAFQKSPTKRPSLRSEAQYGADITPPGEAAGNALDLATRPFQYLSTLVAGLQRATGEAIAEPGTLLKGSSYSLRSILDAAGQRFLTGKVRPGYEQPVAKLYELAVEKYGGDPNSAVHRLISDTLAGVTDPVSYAAMENIAEGVSPKLRAGRQATAEIGRVMQQERLRVVPRETSAAAPKTEAASAGATPTAESPTVGAPTVAGGSVDVVKSPFQAAVSRVAQGLQSALPKPPSSPGGIRASLRNVFIENFNHLRSVSPTGYEAVLEAAGNKGLTKVMIDKLIPQIEQVTGMKWEQFASVLGEGRLRGARQRWVNLGNSVRTATSDEIAGSLKDPAGLGAVLDKLSETHAFSNRLKQQALANLAEGPDSLRAFLIDVFDRAQHDVGHFHLGPATDAFETITSDPKFEAGLKLYKDHFEQPLNEAHAANEGILSKDLGPLNTYYPMIAKRESGAAKGIASIKSRFRAPYQKPKPANYFFTGLAKDYSLEVTDLRSKIQGALRSDYLGHMFTVLEDEGLTAPYTGGTVPDGYVVRDAGPLRQITKASTEIRHPSSQAPFITVERGEGGFKVGVGHTEGEPVVAQSTRTINLPRKQVLVPEWLDRELTPLLEPGRSAVPSSYRDFVGKYTNWAIRGLLEPSIHGSKLMKDLSSTTPFVGNGLLSKTVGNLPVVKYGNAIVRAINTEVTGAEAIRIQEALARAGVLPERSGTIRSPLARVVFGERGLDIKARMQLYKVLEAIEPNPTPTQVHDFVGQLGIYNRALESSIGRFVKDTGLGSFYSAGSSRLRNAVNSWISGATLGAKGTKIPEGHPGYKLMQSLSSGAAGTVALWAGIHKAYTGKWPWQDPNSHLLEIPLSEKDRQSKAAQLIYGPGTDTVYIGLDPFNHVAGGARALGLSNSYNTLMEGGTWGQAEERGVAQSLSTFFQPAISGPIPRAAGTSVLGEAPYIYSFRDPITGSFKPQFIKTVKTKEPGVPQLFENLKEATIGTNGFLRGTFGVMTGGEPGQKRPGAPLGGRALGFAIDMALPGLLKNQVDEAKKQKSLKKEAKATVRTAEREAGAPARAKGDHSGQHQEYRIDKRGRGSMRWVGN